MRNFFKLSVLGFVSALSVGAMAQTINNASFNDPLTTSSPVTNWTDFNTPALPVTVVGSAKEAVLNADQVNNIYSQMMQPLFGLTGGQEYQISFYAFGSGFLDVSDDFPNTTTLGGMVLSNGSVGSGESDASFSAAANGWSSWMEAPYVFRVDSITPSEGLTQYSFKFTATDDTEYLWVKGYTGKANYLQVDNFAITAVTAVPEPETYAMMLAGLGALGLMARRRRVQ